MRLGGASASSLRQSFVVALSSSVVVVLVVSDEPTSLTTLDEYGFRFDIEENFLDDKSNGFPVGSLPDPFRRRLDPPGFGLGAHDALPGGSGTEVVPAR